ncbi:MAG: hypothetical protein SFU85_02985 [Candidatus Methylacidiphilales bacterium]|nr:hypothetical protein [Candidatus Methylacidiphilales bacterium]
MAFFELTSVEVKNRDGKWMNLYQAETFGGIDADTDKLLEECFEDHPAYEKAKDHSKFLIIGRKGSGKTAIYRKLISLKAYDTFSLGFDFSDYPWQHHEKQKAIGVPEEDAYLHAWKYLILISMAKVLLNQDHSQPCSEFAEENLSKIERFIIDSYGTRNPDVTQIFSPARRLKFTGGVSLLFNAANLNFGAESVDMDYLPKIIQEINKNLLEAIIGSLNGKLHYYLCFDQLDLGFNKEESGYSQRLIGLILAARDFNIRAERASKKASVVVFLRDDIYDILRFEDKNKITQTFCSRIAWDKDGSVSLRQLMEKRFSTILGDGKPVDWGAVFDEEEKMRGKQKKYNHIVDRTYMRPRDMIKFCNEILITYKRNKERGAKFSNKDIGGARGAYSNYFYQELRDEIFKHMPQFEVYFEVLKGLSSLQFTANDFEQAWEDRRLITPAGVSFITALKQLFEFSVIGYYAPGGNMGGASYVWKFKDSQALFNEASIQFRVHLGLQEYLGLKKYTKSGSEADFDDVFE